VRRAANHGSQLGRLRPRVVYTDLDGTVFGPGGSLFAGPGGGVSDVAAQALARLHRAGIALVPVSGRTVRQVRETARLLGARDFIAELGGVTSYDLGREVVRAPFDRGGTPSEAMARSGAAGLLLDLYPNRLEPHAPWSLEHREASMLLRGHVDLAHARNRLEAYGYGWLHLEDNGILAGRYEGLEVDEPHVYHLVPRGIGKAAAVEADLHRRGLTREDAVAVGDSLSDAALGPHVGAVFIVANGRRALEGQPLPENVYLTDRAFGEGFAEAVTTVVPG
jgi:hydroxymethylpyrimidine pyrophosphatase-like HAD family hydrolase